MARLDLFSQSLIPQMGLEEKFELWMLFDFLN